MMTTASPLHVVEAADDGAAEAVQSPVFWTGRSVGMRLLDVRSRICQVASVLPSSTTTISWAMPCRRSSTWRCSTVEAMQPSSLRAGITTDSKLERLCGCGRRRFHRPLRLQPVRMLRA